jgi:hypothetical protein
MRAPRRLAQRFAALATAALCAAPGAQAAGDGLAQRLQTCARLDEDAQRLRCFDAEVPRVDLPAKPKLGEEQVQRRAPAAASDAESSLTARVTGLVDQRDGTVTMTLDNGQVWHQQAAEFYFPLTLGETVRIEKGALGSYRLTRVVEGWNKWTRVGRVK